MREENGFKPEEIEYVPYIPNKYEFKKYFDSMRKIDCEDGFSENKRIRPVSYTHLDVYKRQGGNVCIFLGLRWRLCSVSVRCSSSRRCRRRD